MFTGECALIFSSSWRKPFFAYLHPYDMYQSWKQQEQMFHLKNYDRFGKKDAKLRIGEINMQSFCDSNRIYLNSMYAGSSMNNAFEQNFF